MKIPWDVVILLVRFCKDGIHHVVHSDGPPGKNNQLIEALGIRVDVSKG